MGDRFENTAGVEIPELDDYARIVTKAGGTRRALISELAKKIVEEYEGSSLGGEERTIQAAIADAKQVASEAIQEEQTARHEADTTITADLAKKAYADGEYADLHAGTANQILSDTYTTDEEPYHYRQTPSHAGTREIEQIIVASVCWNQLFDNSGISNQTSPYGTEEYVSTSIVPIGHYTKYPTDLKSIVEQIADVPSADGTYTLKAVVSGGKVTYSWESANG